MMFGRILFRMFLVAVGFVVALPAMIEHAKAQAVRMLEIEDQPGVVPVPREEQLSPALRRQMFFYRTSEPPGTIIVDTADRYLYLVQGNNRAMRYGIGVGRDGFQWQG